MVRRISKVRRRGLTAYKLVELLTGGVMYPMMYYDGYGTGRAGGGDDSAENYIDDEMRQDWEANREALMAVWRSGKYTTTDELAEIGLNVRMPPWLFVHGSPGTLPWAGRQSRIAPRWRRESLRALALRHRATRQKSSLMSEPDAVGLVSLLASRVVSPSNSPSPAG